MYKSTPITKKAKTAREYNSALKQTTSSDLIAGAGDAYRTTYRDKGSPGETITGRREKKETYTCAQAVADGHYSSRQECLDATKKRTGSVNPTKEGIEDNTRGTGEFETFTEQKPGTDDFIGDIQEYKKQKRKVLGDLETRELNRTTKKTEKDLRRAKIKEAREARKQAKADGTKRKDRREAFKQSKRTAKQEEIANEKMAFQKRSDLNKEAQSFGLGAGGTYEVDVMKTKSDYTRDQLIADAKNEQRRKLKEAEDEAKAAAGKMRAPLKKNYFKKY
jgi:hypothetical protein